MDEFELIDTEYILSQLFEMITKYDYAEEVGRKALKQLIMNLLSMRRFNANLLKQLLEILSKIMESEALCNEITALVSDIHQPLIETEVRPTVDLQRNLEFRVRFGLIVTARIRI